MTEKITGICKAALTGALLGSIVGMTSKPKKSKKHSLKKDVTGTMRIIGTAMEDVSNLLSK